MAFSFSSALQVLEKQTEAEQFENVYNSLDWEALRDPESDGELCGLCGRGWKCLIYNVWVAGAKSRGWKPKDLRAWMELLVLYDRLKREHKSRCPGPQ